MTVDVVVNNLGLSYWNHHALQNVTFNLSEPKIYGLIGRNGAGKTSLLSILSSFREQTEGTLTIGGEEPFENAKVMPLVNFIYSKDYKDESENAKNLLNDVERYRPNFDRDYAESLLKKFNLPVNKPLKQFSKGMQSAFDVVAGLASRAPITIFDEAYQGMDAPTREIFYQEILEDQSNHPRIMVLSTHLVSEMDYLFDEVLILHKGKLLLQEEYESLITKGASITGTAEEVDDFARDLKQLSVQQLGGTKAVMVYGELDENKRNEAQQRGLEVGHISLQDLFIHLTGEDV
ncbi:ATP-binding cassette domain-containing protein [Cytobacillus purgationiresistens]|uniref:ABC-2 type transport system ATP-binding protein n=1 Tax=Cytobacillus purgationiresistens TaxID=863449 RepID=A0ABU0ADW8_9BACI|nr:ABC transporter ATP-binding protein [Cytobacillus purgationiresistens]MDQ0268638.1 ABC-2 type transport system ATP-binding protein [Cytobacillus purgationiresistens]